LRAALDAAAACTAKRACRDAPYLRFSADSDILTFGSSRQSIGFSQVLAFNRTSKCLFFKQLVTNVE